MHKLRYLIVIVFFVTVLGAVIIFKPENDDLLDDDTLDTETFIQTKFTNDNGTLATYTKETELEESDDVVKGREALSETLGLWMYYALLIEDLALFDEAFEILDEYFLEEDGFVYWKVTKQGKSEVSANALVDDLRISHALWQGAKKWDDERYEKTALLISEYNAQWNENQGVLTDFFERDEQYATHILTLSYIEPKALTMMNQKDVISEKTYEKMMDILKNAPYEGSFFPKEYDVEDKTYHFDDDVNMIDQSLIALNRASSEMLTTRFYEFIIHEMDMNGMIFGQYDLETEKPLVKYESPAVYGWLILYSLEINDYDLVKDLYKRMRQRQVKNFSENNLHIFDSLVPLIATTELEKRGIIEQK